METAFQSGIVSASLQVVLERFASFAINEIGMILGVDDELRKLERTFFKIQGMLSHIDHNRYTNNNNNKSWQVWSKDLKKLSYDADDLLDEISLELSRFNLDAANNSVNDQVRDWVFSSFKLNIPHKISKVRLDLEEIASEMDTLFIAELVKLSAPKITPYCNYTTSSSSSLVDEMLVIGREKDKEAIIRMLLAEESGRNNFTVIPIVGMGGVGKTTLAQLLYNDEKAVNNFELRVWVYVSIQFDVIGVTKSIIESITENCSNLTHLDPLQTKLQTLLRGKKFLLVLDDLWNENYGDWDVLQSPFRVGSRGSKVLVTSRSTIVSSIVGTITAYNLQSLSDTDCWELMKQRALSNKNLVEKDNLELIGKEIAKKCKGLPLAAKTLGCVMHSKSDGKEWDDILKSELWDLPQDNNGIFPALSLSYLHLPAHLKNCFAYCSIFPRSYGYERDDLVLLWMAEGFIRPVGERRLEDIGSDYFKDLLWRSFFQQSHVNIYNQPIYTMHDLIHNVAQLVAADMCFRMEDGMSYWCPLSRYVVHLSLRRENMKSTALKAFHICKSLRTFLVTCDNVARIGQIPFDLFLRLRCLRVLDLSRIGIDELPDSVDHLKHLRYLNLSENGIQKLPESVARLFGLQTLKLKNCFELLELPKNMKDLINLRHLDLDIKRQLNSMPSEFGRLINLQTLDAFIVGRDKGCGIGELKNMRCLRGSICIMNLENVLNVTEAKEAMLGNKRHLDKLELEWNSFRDAFVEQEVLAGLQPHESLKELQVTNYGGVMFPSWLGDPLSCKLVSIHLKSCQPCEVLPPLGQLPFLKSLYIEDMIGLLNVDDGFCGVGVVRGFPSLESLTFHDLPNLKEWRGLNVNDMPCLRKLTIVDCPRLITLPSFHNLTSLEDLNISQCPKLQSLPGEGLPTSLGTLIILESDILKDRCKMEKGEDWDKIKTIPKIEIDYVEIPMQARRI